MAEREIHQDEQTPREGGGGKKWVLLVALLAVLVAGGVGIAVYLLLADSNTEEAADPGPPQRHYHDLESMTVNIESSGQIRYLRVALSIVSLDEAVLQAVDQHLPAIRNRLLGVLSETSYEELNAREGKEALAEKLRAAVAEILEDRGAPHDVEVVRFRDLVMQ